VNVPHQAPAVQEGPRNTVVVASAPASPAQVTRAAAAAVVVPFNYTSGVKQGGP
jgi:hypothetical protein